MPIHQHIQDHARPIKIWAEDLDPRSDQQLRNIADLPIIHSHVAAMPDAHMGIGATVGSVLATRGDHPGGGRGRYRLRHDRRAPVTYG